jgi:hypothetical protein
MYQAAGKGEEAEVRLQKAQSILRDIGVKEAGTCIEDYERTLPIRFR